MLLNLKEKRINDFWTWFAGNSKLLGGLKEDDYSLINSLKQKLQKINDKLIFELNFTKNSEDNQLVISADGLVDAFEDVIRVVEESPISIEGWNIKAFRQKKDIKKLRFKMNKTILTCEDVFFTYYPDFKTNLINVNIYINEIRKIDNEVKQIALLFLDSALGEFDAATKINKIYIGTSNQYKAELFESKLHSLVKLEMVVGKHNLL
ncbi:MAG: hypothetical protein Q9M91_01055 [Candidatus Dojkabacteria bacterium]|nr:hypothetical protein [Candidatus Dojkabacteria bacterium]MDQ7020415.1 hypothetical protein [Candidatus Dojkabacteria bacterium]